MIIRLWQVSLLWKLLTTKRSYRRVSTTSVFTRPSLTATAPVSTRRLEVRSLPALVAPVVQTNPGVPVWPPNHVQMITYADVTQWTLTCKNFKFTFTFSWQMCKQNVATPIQLLVLLNLNQSYVFHKIVYI